LAMTLEATATVEARSEALPGSKFMLECRQPVLEYRQLPRREAMQRLPGLFPVEVGQCVLASQHDDDHNADQTDSSHQQVPLLYLQRAPPTGLQVTRAREHYQARLQAEPSPTFVFHQTNFVGQSAARQELPLNRGGSLVSRGNYFDCQLGAYIGRQFDMNAVRTKRSDFVERLDQPFVHIDTQFFLELLCNLFVGYFAVELA